jgi:predicted Holliday junction resolvase-like endonuclease
MFVLLLSFIAVLLVLILLQLRKNIKETEKYFAVLDLSMRQFLANSSNSQNQFMSEQLVEIKNQLEKISNNTEPTPNQLKKDTKTIEDFVYGDDTQQSQWLPSQRIVE